VKKLSILAGISAVVAAALIYVRPHSAPSPQVDPVPNPISVSAPVAVVERTVVARQAERKDTLVPKKSASSQQIRPQNVDASDERSLPEPLVDEGVVNRDEIELWQLPETEIEVTVDDLPAVKFDLDPAVLTSLHVGQIVRFPLPEGAGDIEAEILQTYNDPAGIQVWKGKVRNDVHQASLIITRGHVQTHIVIATTQGNYSAVVDNRSGDGTLINESTIHSRQLPYDDGIVYRPGETETSHQH
jgi:hypothetical protein